MPETRGKIPRDVEMQNTLCGSWEDMSAQRSGNEGGTDEELPKRQQWSSQLDFMLSCIGYSVGLGNVWRFPYLCYINGGGVFLIPYLLTLLLAGIPCYMMEVALGQFMKQGGIGAWKITPLFIGIGYSSIVVVFYSNVYYTIILAWAIYYLIQSFTTTELPWASCGHIWNSASCQKQVSCLNSSFGHSNSTLFNISNRNCGKTNGSSPILQYWENNVLRDSGSLNITGSVNWDLFPCLIAAWLMIFLCICRDLRATEKVMYFTAIFPYVMLLALFLRSVMLPGAVDGILYYIKADWSKLANPKVWRDACTQIFLSYGLGFGSLPALGSYNAFNSNCYRNSIILAIINSATSVFAGFLVFSVLGFMAKEQGVAISDVAQSGPGLAFIAYPQAVALMPLSQLWASLFFFMLILLGLDTQFVGVQSFVTAFTDLFPKTLRTQLRKNIFLIVCCTIKFLLGIYLITSGGIYIFQLIDSFAVSGVALLWQMFWESIIISWVYGAERFVCDIARMVGFKPTFLLKWCWAVFTPLLCLSTVIFNFAQDQSPTYKKYVYPAWGEAIGWLMALSSMLCMPCTLLFLLLREKEGSLKQRWRLLNKPIFGAHITNEQWSISNGASVEHRHQ
uniref:sodium- and chloride-dependent creatine transporter 1-like n=1 Tax=Myxine glutinosa TaxID=7769 RepID=UPI00358FEFA2